MRLSSSLPLRSIHTCTIPRLAQVAHARVFSTTAQSENAPSLTPTRMVPSSSAVDDMLKPKGKMGTSARYTFIYSYTVRAEWQ